MSYTQMIRNYLKDRKGTFFDIQKESGKFIIIPKKTLMRILNRLEDEGLVSGVCKGLYFINDEVGYSKEKLINYFTSSGRGMLVGYALYNKLGITDYKSGETYIYTNAIGCNKNIDNVHLIKKDLLIFTKGDEAIITALEIIEFGFNNIIDYDFIETFRVIQKCLLEYKDLTFRCLIPYFNYQLSIINKLKEQLDRLLVPNDCIDIYQKTRKCE